MVVHVKIVFDDDFDLALCESTYAMQPEVIRNNGGCSKWDDACAEGKCDAGQEIFTDDHTIIVHAYSRASFLENGKEVLLKE